MKKNNPLIILSGIFILILCTCPTMKQEYQITQDMDLKIVTPLAGIDSITAGKYNDLPGGRLYLPANWDAGIECGWPVSVILHGFGTSSRSTSTSLYWRPLADELGIVLFFLANGHNGWNELRDSVDTYQIVSTLREFRKLPWVNPDALQVFGLSAGAIMAMGMPTLNTIQQDGKPLFNYLAAGSGGFGYVMEKELESYTFLKNTIPVPVLVFWGDKEADDHGKDAARYLSEMGWPVTTITHPGGHIFPENMIRAALSQISFKVHCQ